MNQKFRKIWELALPYQDKRDDKGHAEIVTNYAIQLCKIENTKDDIVVPAAILHDIGWSQLPKEKRFLIFSPNKTPEMEYAVRIKHQKEGVKLAQPILKKVGYPPNFSKHILEIISGHDTRKNFYSKEDGLTRDADKLWMYTKIGFNADMKRNNFTFEDVYKQRKSFINKQKIFYSKSARKIATKELEERKKESKI